MLPYIRSRVPRTPDSLRTINITPGSAVVGVSRTPDSVRTIHITPGSAVAEGKPRRGRKPVKKPLRLPRENLDFTCEVCGRKLVGRASYSVHMKTHRMKPLLQCDQCEFRYVV